MRLKINGEERELPGPIGLLEFLRSKEIDPRFIVVEHNGTILRRGDYGDVTLNEGDVVEIVHMMGGGLEGRRMQS